MNFFERYKKLLIIIGFILLSVLMGYGIYFLFFKSASPSTISPTGETTITGEGFPTASEGGEQIITEPGEGEAQLPTEEETGEKASDVAQGGLTKVTDLSNTSSLGATLSSDGSDVQYYNQADGKFYRIDKYGKATPLSDQVFYNVEKVTWAPNKEKAILEYPDGANIVYNFDTEKQITLPKHWEDFNYSPNGQQIIAKSIGLDPENRWLTVSNDDGSKVRAIEAIGENADTVYTEWSPNGQSIAMYTKGVDFNRQEVFFVGLNDENFKSTIIEGRGFDPLWSPTGDRLLYSVYSSDNDMKPNLWVVDAKGDNIGDNRKNLNIETWASKCAYSSNSEIYCAIPEKLEEGAGVFPEMALNTKDRLFKINTATGLKKLVAVPDGTYNMSNVTISENGYYLYFTDATTGHIEQIKLK